MNYSSESDVPSTTPGDEDDIWKTLSMLLAWTFLPTASIGAVVNVLSIYIFTRPVMRSSVNVLLAGLSAIDLSLLLMSIFVFGLPVLLQWFDLHELTYRQYMSFIIIYIYPVNMMAQTSSVLTMVVITCERWIAVCHPLQVRYYCSVRKSRTALLGVLVVSVAYNVVRFWEYNSVWTNGTLGYETNLRNFNHQSIYMYSYYTGAYLVTHFLIPFSLLLCLNGHSCYTIFKMRAERRRLTRQERGEQRTTMMMLLIVCIFACCNTLPFVMNFVEAAHPDIFYVAETMNVAQFFNDVSNFLVMVNSATTAIIYYKFSQKYRRLFRELWPCTDTKGGCRTHAAIGNDSSATIGVAGRNHRSHSAIAVGSHHGHTHPQADCTNCAYTPLSSTVVARTMSVQKQKGRFMSLRFYNTKRSRGMRDNADSCVDQQLLTSAARSPRNNAVRERRRERFEQRSKELLPLKQTTSVRRPSGGKDGIPTSVQRDNHSANEHESHSQPQELALPKFRTTALERNQKQPLAPIALEVTTISPQRWPTVDSQSPDDTSFSPSKAVGFLFADSGLLADTTTTAISADPTTSDQITSL